MVSGKESCYAIIFFDQVFNYEELVLLLLGIGERGVGKGRVVGKAQVGVKKSYLEGAAELEAAAGGPKVRLRTQMKYWFLATKVATRFGYPRNRKTFGLYWE